MKFLADEGVDRSIVNGLRALGFDVYYVIDETRSLSDEMLLQVATIQERILITRDKDFGELVFRLNRAHCGVVLLGLEGCTTNQRSALVCTSIEKYQDQLAGSFTVIQQEIIRIRPVSGG